MKSIKLSKRLAVIAELVEDNASVVDVGTDHGFIPVFLAQTGKAKRIIASDISAASLSAARRTADEYDVSESITFINTPGLDGINPGNVDTIIIAGLGGETIVRILEDTLWTRHNNVKLILQPQSKLWVLFRFLYDCGHEIKQIKYIFEKNKRYSIIQAATV